MIGLQNEQKYKDKLIYIIEKQIPRCKVYLFGSRADRTNRPGSDIDLAIDCGKQIYNSILVKIKNDIEDSTIPFLVDVLDIYSIDESFRSKIFKDGVLWKS